MSVVVVLGYLVLVVVGFETGSGTAVVWGKG